MFSLIRRFPPFWAKRHTSGHILGHIDAGPTGEVSTEAKKRYPDLAAEIDDLERLLVPAFTELDIAALHAQDRFRRNQMLLIAGALVVTLLGGVQAAFGATKALPWVVVTQAALSAGLGGFASYVTKSNMQARYAEARLKAEALRREYFLYLGHAGPYAKSDDPQVVTLRKRVIEIHTGATKP
jgi:hypothetical protein